METFLTINDSCFLWFNMQNGVLYNSENKQTYYFPCNPAILSDCERLTDLINLYSIKIKDNDLEDSAYKSWISNILSLEMGKTISQDETELKPISLPPILTNFKDVNRLKIYKNSSVGEELLTYLHEVSIDFGDGDSRPLIYKQINAPSDNAKEISLGYVKSILSQIDSQYLQRLNLIGDKLLHRKDFPEILELLKRTDAIKTVIVNARSLLSCQGNILKCPLAENDIHIQVICASDDDLLTVEKLLIKNNLEYKLIILLTSERDIDKADQICSALQSQEYEIKPIYTGDNLDFFKENVFVTKEELMEPDLSKREVFANQALNSNFFGRLAVMPDGEIYANVNHPSLGNIEKDTIYEMIYKEMDKGTSWRMTRDTVKPCSECLFRYLCPPPSNYELVIGKPNLCNVME